MEEIQMCATCGHNILRGEDFVCEIGHDVPCAWVRQSVPHAAAVARVAELEGEVGRLTRELMAATAADDAHEALLRQVSSARAEALARAEAAERERDEAKESRNKAWAEKDKEVEGRNVWEERAQESHRECERRDAWAKRLRLRAEAAEAREAGLKEALEDAARILLNYEERPTPNVKLIHDAWVTLRTALKRFDDALAAAPAKEPPPIVECESCARFLTHNGTCAGTIAEGCRDYALAKGENK